MLLNAGIRTGGGPMRYLGAPLAHAVERNTWAQAGAVRNFHAGEGTVQAGVGLSATAGFPLGALHPAAWSLPHKPGGMSSRYNASMGFDAIGPIVGGITTTGAASFVVDFASADGGLIASGGGAATFAFDGAAELLGILSGTGSSAFSLSTNSPLLGADAGMVGEATWSLTAAANILPANDAPPARTATATFSFSGTLLPYAIGSMEGSTLAGGDVLTADQIAAATVAALQGTTIPVNVAKVNDVTIDGVGTSLDPWGPA